MGMRSCFLVAAATLCTLPAACLAQSEACTEIGCEDRIVLTFAQSPGDAYWFEVDADGVLLPCNLPEAEIPSDAAFSYECGSNGVILSAPSQPRYSVTLSIYDAESLAPVVESQSISLSVEPDAEPIAPNGPSCPPVCYERFGTLL
jgi:hypothetical protein